MDEVESRIIRWVTRWARSGVTVAIVALVVWLLVSAPAIQVGQSPGYLADCQALWTGQPEKIFGDDVAISPQGPISQYIDDEHLEGEERREREAKLAISAEQACGRARGNRLAILALLVCWGRRRPKPDSENPAQGDAASCEAAGRCEEDQLMVSGEARCPAADGSARDR